MKRLFQALVVVWAFMDFGGGPSSAALISRDWLVPGDGLLTLDTATNLEWLDVSQTALSLFPGVLLEDRYQSAVAQTQSGERFAGFAPASPAQALQLAVNAGITLETDDFATNSAGALLLIDLVGSTQPANHGGLKLLGLLDEITFDLSRPQRTMFQMQHLPQLPPSPFPRRAGADVVSAYFFTQRYPPGDGNMAVLLVRPVPEPGTAFLISLALLFMATLRRRSVRFHFRA